MPDNLLHGFQPCVKFRLSRLAEQNATEHRKESESC
jgi:hypothetical protein